MIRVVAALHNCGWHVGWCWRAYGSMGCAPTYEGACRAAEAEIKRRIRNRMAVL